MNATSTADAGSFGSVKAPSTVRTFATPAARAFSSMIGRKPPSTSTA